MKKLIKVSSIILGALVIGFVAFLIWAYMPVPAFKPAVYEPIAPYYWPTKAWQYSTPEEQGMNSETLLDMMAFYEKSAADNPELYIDSMTVIRNGYIVAEFYNNPLFLRDELHVIHSATKSIVGALIGIAIKRGYINSIDVPIVEIFADRKINNLDERKRAMTIKHLLSMETGLHSRDSFLYAYEGLFEMQHADDWLQYALDLPMAAQPGERFDYSNISTFLLSAIIMESTDMDTLEFAKAHLFEPLGIKDVKWEWNSEGLPIAWARMWLKPNDMAKIGLLYLQQGVWEAEQVIPREWVRDSLTPHAYPQNAVDILNADLSKNQDASTRNWVAQRLIRPFTDGYGYQWWLDRDGHYNALGTSGQYIMVAPEQNLIFVATSKSTGASQFMPASLFYDYVLAAVESGKPMPVNEAAKEKIESLAVPATLSEDPAPVRKLPSIAADVSGVTYLIEANPFNTNNIRFVFDPTKDYAELSYTARESWNIGYRIGLDHVRRVSDSNNSTFAAVGEWTSPDTFSLEVEIVGYSTFDRWEFRFNHDEIHITEHSISGDFTYSGRLQTSSQ